MIQTIELSLDTLVTSPTGWTESRCMLRKSFATSSRRPSSLTGSTSIPSASASIIGPILPSRHRKKVFSAIASRTERTKRGSAVTVLRVLR